ncbi:hypothetical protein CEUSTIGMA_g9361.t1 [Chlamydomonas eustigma]|uniref:Protein XRP2 n=1 Tax=Chlamydomonas eustigma TaxID=1157962 RepID=A0A250XFU6_9CHLO|nr:hypothetical protein CEUSTIGMA_g9361.t1 [Chlamydomonas eustigma]|eukprot:GAX81933.1 hypothetical protein CEUSTIGMA_g9361.t1 [Chlamydomonas eustigma]
MGCCSSKEERELKYLEKNHIPLDEVSKKHKADSLKKRSSEIASRDSNPRNKKSGEFSILQDPSSNSPAVQADEVKEKTPPTSPPSRPQVNNYKPKKPKLDVKDFQFVNLKGEVRVKPPGSINGQAFSIDTCEDCDLYVVDACAQVMIDKAKNCRIFLGPTEGSVFIRDSVSCKFAIICRQLRTRDCHNMDISLFCRTMPIVESSSQLGFFCYDLNYEALTSHMQKAKLSTLHNFWSRIYDFTPKAGNWRLLDPDHTVQKLLAPVPEEAKAAFGEHGKEGPLFVTWGDRDAPSNDYMFVIFSKKKEEQAMQFIDEAKQKATILRCNKVAIGLDMATKMVNTTSWAKSAERDLSEGECVGVEISGPGCVSQLQGSAAALSGYVTEKEEVGAMFRYLGVETGTGHQ